MMRGSMGLAAAIVLIAGGAAMAAAPQPAAGNYAAYSYVVSNTNSGTGPCPGSRAGDYYTGQFVYPGPGATGAVLYNVGLAGSTGFVQLATFTPVTPAAGTRSWTGKGIFSTSPSGGTTKTKFNFTWKFTFFTEASFEADLSYTVPGTVSGTCTQTNHVLFVQTN